MQIWPIPIIIKISTIIFVTLVLIDGAATLAKAPNDDDEFTPPPTPAELPVVTVTGPAITARPTRKFSKPLPPCILGCLEKAVTSSRCGRNDDKCACVNPVYQVTSRTCIKYTCSADEQELASRIQQKCSETLEVRPAFRPHNTMHETASLTTNVMAVMTGKSNNGAAVIQSKKGRRLELFGVISAVMLMLLGGISLLL